ncbi:MAG: TerB family tellurite resistance protein [Bacteroidales bacterium]|nr:TerB family tellurite resistance protein [Bacteroidales bacterium]
MGFGKWIGGGLGWAFGGPLGALIGYGLGSILDGAAAGGLKQLPSGQTSGGDFAVSLLVLTAAVMKADGKVLKSELDYVKRFLVNQFGAANANEQLQVLRDILKQDIPVRDVCFQIRNAMDYSAKLQLMHYLWGIAQSDGHIDTTEKNLLEQIAVNLGIAPADADSIKAMFVHSTDEAYKILETTQDASNGEVKKAFRKMAVKYHPDKVSHLGEDYKKAAEEKIKKVNDAYEKIKKERGFK